MHFQRCPGPSPSPSPSSSLAPRDHKNVDARIFSLANTFLCVPLSATPLKWCKTAQLPVCSMCLIRNSVCFVSLTIFMTRTNRPKAAQHFVVGFVFPPPHTPLHLLVPHYLLWSFLRPHSHSRNCGTFPSRPTWALCTLYCTYCT